MSKIVELNVQQVKRITAAHIYPDGSMVIIGGRNEQGKSSVLDAIAYAIGGKRLVPSRPLRDGADKGSVEVKLDDGITIKRTFTPGGGGTLKITNEDGMSPGSAQTWLDKRIGSLSFDPAAFLRDKDQAKTLRELCGADTSDLDAERAKVYAERTDVNRDLKRAQGAVDSAEHFPDAPDVEVSIGDLMDEQRAARDAERATDQIRQDAERLREMAADLDIDAGRLAANADASEAIASINAENLEAVADIDEQIERLKKRRADLDARAVEAIDRAEQRAAAAKEDADKMTARAAGNRKEADALDKRYAEAVERLPDADAIEEKIRTADETNRQIRANASRAKLEAERAGHQKRSDAMTERIAEIDKERAAILAAAEFPVPGLSIDPAGVVTLNDLPLDQASQAQQIRVSMGVGLALSPDIRIILIRDGSLLDSDNLKLVADVAEEHDAQVWVERVGDADEGAIVIEDGEILT